MSGHPPLTLPPGAVIPPPYIKVFGPGANCTLALCPVEISVYGYRPSLAANGVLLALYVLSGLVHAALGRRWKTPFFAASMVLGALNAVAGYAGRIALHFNPFSFAAFMVQIICVTSGPVYYSAAIYVTLAKAITHLAPGLSRIRPVLFYWIFISLDLVCLVFQAAGGALSTASAGASQAGVGLALVGLSLQVAAMTAFGALFADFLARYFRSDAYRTTKQRQQQQQQQRPTEQGGGGGGGPWDQRLTRQTRLRLFFAGLGTAFVLILTRCCYRLVELRDGYRGELIRDEPLFIGLEGVMIIVAVYCLMVGHPGLAFREDDAASESTTLEK